MNRNSYFTCQLKRAAHDVSRPHLRHDRRAGLERLPTQAEEQTASLCNDLLSRPASHQLTDRRRRCHYLWRSRRQPVDPQPGRTLRRTPAKKTSCKRRRDGRGIADSIPTASRVRDSKAVRQRRISFNQHTPTTPATVGSVSPPLVLLFKVRSESSVVVSSSPPRWARRSRSREPGRAADEGGPACQLAAL